VSGSTIEALRRAQESRPPSRAFGGRTAEELAVWRRESLARLAEIYRLRRQPAAAPVRVAGSAARDGHREERLLLAAPDGVEMPAYLLVPPGPGPFPAVVFLHGHDASAEHVLGKADPDPGGHGAYHAYMRSLRWVEEAPRAGHLCLIPEQRGLGELAEPTGPGCQHLVLNALAFGTTLQGLRVADLVRWVDYLVGRPDAQPGRLAVGGVSLGGELAVLLAAFDERVDAAIPAGHVRLLREELHGSAFCSCGYAPGLFAEFDLPEIAGLIAPRPLLVQSGDRDPLYPRSSAEAGIARLREIYAAAGGSVDASFFPGGHEFDGPGALRWLERLWQTKPS
jgi:dienelactone hydrolase